MRGCVSVGGVAPPPGEHDPGHGDDPGRPAPPPVLQVQAAVMEHPEGGLGGRGGREGGRGGKEGGREGGREGGEGRRGGREGGREGGSEGREGEREREGDPFHDDHFPSVHTCILVAAAISPPGPLYR